MAEHSLLLLYRPGRSVRWALRLAKPSLRTVLWLVVWALAIAFLLLFAWMGAREMRSSDVQARVFADQTKKLTFALVPGTSGKLEFPRGGPYDERLGYSRLPQFIANLKTQDFAITDQARQSADLRAVATDQGYALYHEKQHAGLVLRDRTGKPLYAASYPEDSYDGFDSIPPLIVRTLLFIEDRDLLETHYPHYNPAIEWKRFGQAGVGWIGGFVNPHLRRGGASTLATQIEKFRHSQGGRTLGPFEKLRQMQAATLRAYLDGADTYSARQRIVTTYLDSTPLGSRPGYGEVIGLGDGLMVWYGTDVVDANRILSDTSGGDLARKAEIYKQVLSLLLAERRPAWYLAPDHSALIKLTDAYLGRLVSKGVIDAELYIAALDAPLVFRPHAPAPAPVSFVGRKGADAIRAELLETLGASSLYDLDHLDLSATTTIDSATQRRVTDFLAKLRDPQQVESLGLVGKDLLGGGDPAKVTYSIVLYERNHGQNLVRVHADSLDEPFDLNSGAKLQLGSTAKLRTLINYLEIIERLHAQYASLPANQLKSKMSQAQDPLSQWALGYLAGASDRSLQPMLDAAMQRKYSASTGETFFTGGGAHAFHNFKKWEDYEHPTVENAFANSINLVFVRILRDIERYYTAEDRLTQNVFDSGPDDPARKAFIRRFADQEGRVFMNRFYKDLHGLKSDQLLEALARKTGPWPHRLTVVFRALRPNADVGALRAFLLHETHGRLVLNKPLEKVYDEYAPGKFSLADQGYVSRVHPLELWMASYLEHHPGASHADVIKAGTNVRQEVYGWLFKTRNLHRQNFRIRILVEQEAFKRITADWRRLGFPFAHLVPSLATAIGSSGDRPDALADLMGIIANNGLRQPTVDVRSLSFAAGTPYETDLTAGHAKPQRLLSPELATSVRHALTDVVDEGTGKRFIAAYHDENGKPLVLGGKTGTGDNRFESFSAGGGVIGSRVVDRTATFVFFLGDRFFGTITAYVPGKDAARFHFTSALAVQILATLSPEIQPLFATRAEARS